MCLDGRSDSLTRSGIKICKVKFRPSQLKRGINGTYVSVEPFHLFRYLDEQTFRYNNPTDMNDEDRFNSLQLALSQIVGKRLTWNHLTGKQIDPETCVN